MFFDLLVFQINDQIVVNMINNLISKTNKYLEKKTKEVFF